MDSDTQNDSRWEATADTIVHRLPQKIIHY